MSKSILLKSGTIVNEGKQFVADILIKNGRIEKISSSIETQENCEVIDLSKNNLVPIKIKELLNKN